MTLTYRSISFHTSLWVQWFKASISNSAIFVFHFSILDLFTASFFRRHLLPPAVWLYNVCELYLFTSFLCFQWCGYQNWCQSEVQAYEQITSDKENNSGIGMCNQWIISSFYNQTNRVNKTNKICKKLFTLCISSTIWFVLHNIFLKN